MTIIEEFRKIEDLSSARSQIQTLSAEKSDLEYFNKNIIEKIGLLNRLCGQYEVIIRFVNAEDPSITELNINRNKYVDSVLSIMQSDDKNFIYQYQTHALLNSHFLEFSKSLEKFINMFWNSHTAEIKHSLLPLNDLQLYKKVFQNHNQRQTIHSIIDDIINKQETIRQKLCDCPESIKKYDTLMNQFKIIDQKQKQLHDYFPDNFRQFLVDLFSPNGAKINDFTDEVRVWFADNNLTNSICIKAR